MKARALPMSAIGLMDKTQKRDAAFVRCVEAFRTKRGEHDAERAYATAVRDHEEQARAVIDELSAPGGLWT